MILSPTRFDEIKAIGPLPSPTGVALSLLRLTSTEGTIAEITRALETDPALVGRVLKMANTSQNGVSRPIASAREAVVRLGLRAVSNVALGFWLVDQAGRRPCQGFDYKQYWLFSLALAVAAKTLSDHKKVLPPDEAFTCGLLCQVGRLALATIFPDAYNEILSRCPNQDLNQLALNERERFATDHSEMAVALMRDWGLPPEYSEAVLYQSLGRSEDLPEGSKSRGLARVLGLATALARVCTVPEEERGPSLQEYLERGKAQGYQEDTLIDLGDKVIGEWQRWGNSMDINTEKVPSFTELAEKTSGPSRPSHPGFSPPHRDRALRILLFSPEPEDSLPRLLQEMGHHPGQARSRAEAMEKVIRDQPQMLIVDGFGACGDGFALCQQLRQTFVGQSLYLLALSDSDNEDHLANLIEHGADNVLQKPVRSGSLAVHLRAGSQYLRLREEVHRDKEELRRFTAELVIVNRRLQHAAFEDPLTRLPNRRYAMERIEQEWSRSSRTDRPLACIMADIDHFKRINDTFGHDAGDLVLQSTAETLRKALRLSDVVCRLGGEEFLILCPETDQPGGQRCAERIRGNIEANKIKSQVYQGNITISLGLALRQEKMTRSSDLLKAADQALYQAKQAGRNRVGIFS